MFDFNLRSLHVTFVTIHQCTNPMLITSQATTCVLYSCKLEVILVALVVKRDVTSSTDATFWRNQKFIPALELHQCISSAHL